MAEQTRKHPKLRLGRLVVCSVVVLLVALVVVNLTVARLPEMPPADGKYISLHGKEIHYFEQPDHSGDVFLADDVPPSNEVRPLLRALRRRVRRGRDGGVLQQEPRGRRARRGVP